MTDRDDAPDLDDEPELDGLAAELRSLRPEDLDLAQPPLTVWEGIEQGLHQSPGSHRSAGTGRWSSGARRALFGVAAGALVATGLALAVRRDGPAGTVVSEAALSWDSVRFDPLGAQATADAELIKRDHHYELRLIGARLPNRLAETADLELWMISLDASGAPADIAPIALVDARRPGTYRVPDGVDISTHVVVDLSVEPRDGDTKHSGRSILRGALKVA